jgi:hypothetical protein
MRAQHAAAPVEPRDASGGGDMAYRSRATRDWKSSIELWLNPDRKLPEELRKAACFDATFLLISIAKMPVGTDFISE